MKIKKTLSLNSSFLDDQSVLQTHFDISTNFKKFPTTETCLMKVSEYFISTSSSTLAIGRGAEI